MNSQWPRAGLALALLLGLGVCGLASSAHAAVQTFVTINGSCGVNVSVGQRICIQYGYNALATDPQALTGLLTVQKGTGPEVQLFNGQVFANTPNELCDGVGTGPANRIIRFRVRTADGATQLASCTYIVGTQSQTPPQITTRLLVNRKRFVDCGSIVGSGTPVHLVFSSNQSGTAEVFIRKENAASPTLLARGSVTAGRNYAVGVIAGAADAFQRTFTVRVTSASGTGTASCAYIVPAPTEP
jgi:hypothetical protein